LIDPNKNSSNHSTNAPPEWFCVRSLPKHEHIGATYLRKDLGIEVFLPRIRFKRATRRGPVWFTEPLFPGYFFARFHLETHLKEIHYARGVQGVLHFGNQWPRIPHACIEDLRATLEHQDIHVVSDEIRPGDAVEVAGGLFHGLKAVVTRVMSSGARVGVLLEFLGRQAMVELPGQTLVRWQAVGPCLYSP